MSKLQIPLHYIFLDLYIHMLFPFKLIMCSYMFPWSNMYVMNAYVDNVCIHEDDNNIPK